MSGLGFKGCGCRGFRLFGLRLLLNPNPTLLALALTTLGTHNPQQIRKYVHMDVMPCNAMQWNVMQCTVWYACMDGRMYICMCACMYACTYACMHICTYVNILGMYACMHVLSQTLSPPFQQKVGKTSASNARDLASSQANEQESNEIVTQIVLVICSAPALWKE